MTTNKVDVASSPTTVSPAGAPPPGNSGRLVALLAILVAAIGCLAFDQLVAKPGCDAADKKIQEFVDARNKLGVKEGSLVTPDDLHKELQMMPTWVDKHAAENYEVEYYCWLGQVPFFNTRRHFITVVYHGQEPRHFSSHHRELPPAEALPIVQPPATTGEQPLPTPTAKDADAAPSSDAAPAAAADAPPAEAKPAENKAADEPATGKDK